MQKYRLPIKTLFEILEINNITYDTPVKVKHHIKISSPSGFVDINFFVKKYHNTAKYVLDNNTSITCSVDHIVFEDGVPKQIKNCSRVDTISGTKTIIQVNDIDTNDVYDVSLDHPHTYITPNGIIHHNTTIAKVLINELNIEPADFMYINASKENGVDTIRRKVSSFGETMPWGDLKIILLDESDRLTVEGQDALRATMEQYSSSVRFILTGNYPNRISDPLKSRCNHIVLKTLDETDFAVRLAEILVAENIEFDLSTLDLYIRATYPDMRKTIGNIEANVFNSKLENPNEDDSETSEWKLKMVELFKNNKITDARKHICKHIKQDEYIEMYQFLYRNLDFFSKNEEMQDEAVLIIRNGLVKHGQVADPEINLSATLIELSQIEK